MSAQVAAKRRAGNFGQTSEYDDVPATHVDRDWYRSPEIFAEERDKIFRRVWHFACALPEVEKPGDYFSLTVADQPILVMRGRDGVLRAFLNACTHRGVSLTADCNGAKGNCGHALTCIYHGWTFDTLGQLVGAPYPNAYGPDFDRKQLGLVPIHCDVFGSLVFVAIDPVKSSLTEFLGTAAEWVGPAVENLELLGRASWLYDGNWKLWHENFRDNYHPLFSHGLVRDMNPRYPEGGSNYGLPPGHSMLVWPNMMPEFERFDKALKATSAIDVNTMQAMSHPHRPYSTERWWRILGIFPNLDFQRPEHFAYQLQVCHPIAADRTRVEILFLAPRGEDPNVRRYRLETAANMYGSWGEVSVDDCEASERSGIGLRALGTRYSNIARGTAPGNLGETMDEYSLREFYSEYRRYLFGDAE